jgi:hypothetical protein
MPIAHPAWTYTSFFLGAAYASKDGARDSSWHS